VFGVVLVALLSACAPQLTEPEVTEVASDAVEFTFEDGTSYTVDIPAYVITPSNDLATMWSQRAIMSAQTGEGGNLEPEALLTAVMSDDAMSARIDEELGEAIAEGHERVRMTLGGFVFEEFSVMLPGGGDE
jgi:hypothetical protein